MDPQVFRDIELPELAQHVASYHERGWRFVNLCGSTVAGQVELLATFSLGEALENLRLLVDTITEVPAISPTYANAFFFENEVHDLFGVQFAGITIDFGGHFYPTSVPTPMNPASAQAIAHYTEGAGKAPDAAASETAPAPDAAASEASAHGTQGEALAHDALSEPTKLTVGEEVAHG